MADSTTKIDDVEQQPRGARRHALRIAIGAVVVAAVIAVIVWRLRASNFRWEAFAASFRGVNWWWFAMAVFVNYGTYFGRALRWEVMIRPLRAGASIWKVFTATLIGFTAVVLLGRPGELVRPYLIATKERLPFSSQMAAWLLERIFDLLLVVAIFSFALTRIPPETAAAHPTLAHALSTAGWFAGALAAICFAVLFMFGRYPEQARERLNAALGVLPQSLGERVDRLVSTFMTGMQSASSRGYLTLLAGYSVAEWILIGGTAWCIFKAFPATANTGAAGVCIFLGFVAFGSIVQIPGIGGGPQVAGVIALSDILNVSVESATAISLVFWFVSFVTVVPAGLALAVHEGVNWRKLSHLKDEI